MTYPNLLYNIFICFLAYNFICIFQLLCLSLHKQLKGIIMKADSMYEMYFNLAKELVNECVQKKLLVKNKNSNYILYNNETFWCYNFRVSLTYDINNSCNLTDNIHPLFIVKKITELFSIKIDRNIENDYKAIINELYDRIKIKSLYGWYGNPTDIVIGKSFENNIISVDYVYVLRGVPNNEFSLDNESMSNGRILNTTFNTKEVNCINSIFNFIKYENQNDYDLTIKAMKRCVESTQKCLDKLI